MTLGREQGQIKWDEGVMSSRWIDGSASVESKSALARKECRERAAAAVRGGERVLEKY